MILETRIPPFLEWLPMALGYFAQTAVIVALVGLVIGFLVAAIRHGPLAAGDITYRTLSAAAVDFVHIAPRRVYAIARLAIQESIRRRVWVVFVVFALVLLFAGWFLDPNSKEPAKLYLSFVLWWTNLLVLFMAMFLAAFSLPNEIKNRIIYTVVTKPVRSGEIILGRMIGFTVIGTAMLLIMGIVSYLFVTRSLRHEHEIADFDQTTGEGQTTTVQGHSHTFTIEPGQNGWTDYQAQSGHRHPIIAEEKDGQTVYRIGEREDLAIARVPILGNEQEFYMLERNGEAKYGPKAGVSVGQEWGYRRFIEGNSLMAAIWTFDNVNERRFPNDGLLIERTIRVFRTHKGDMRRGVGGEMILRNPQTKIATAPMAFTAKEFVIDSQWINRKQPIDPKLGDPSNRAAVGEQMFRSADGAFDQEAYDDFVASGELDIFRDLVSDDGKLEVLIRCTDDGQYYGAARPDLYLRAEDAPFELNFVKGYIGIWCQLVLIVAFGVMFSTFLSGPVAFLATLGTLVMGLCVASFVMPLTQSVIEQDVKLMPGGGPIESGIRLVTQKGIMSQMDDTPGIKVARTLDIGMMYVMQGLGSLMPDLSRFDDAHFVAQGFDVPTNLILQQLAITAAFVLATFLAGFLFMRMREVAK
jgi:ABC-type transport system involved in multi-copper enzyme maturation permease subunit